MFLYLTVPDVQNIFYTLLNTADARSIRKLWIHRMHALFQSLTQDLCGPMCYVSSMRWCTVLEKMKDESSKHGRANARFFFCFLFSLRRAFSFFFSQKANNCPPFKIIYYFARCSCIACTISLKPMLARSPRSFRN